MSKTDLSPFVISREFRAPRSLLWQVQTQAEHLQHWLSPEGFHTIHADMDFRVGGRYHYGLEGPNGFQMWGLQKIPQTINVPRIYGIRMDIPPLRESLPSGQEK